MGMRRVSLVRAINIDFLVTWVDRARQQKKVNAILLEACGRYLWIRLLPASALCEASVLERSQILGLDVGHQRLVTAVCEIDTPGVISRLVDDLCHQYAQRR
ncbi:hypothetical protein [Vibrio coralliilyticus]|uniref:hypothetical protein n=1 Tax=Vibrio coralliilyticus TaxID=190893 RepID=UPI000C1684BB|nr:hypothetical protein [Vibrio coralliilyticus]